MTHSRIANFCEFLNSDRETCHQKRRKSGPTKRKKIRKSRAHWRRTRSRRPPRRAPRFRRRRSPRRSSSARFASRRRSGGDCRPQSREIYANVWRNSRSDFYFRKIFRRFFRRFFRRRFGGRRAGQVGREPVNISRISPGNWNKKRHRITRCRNSYLGNHFRRRFERNNAINRLAAALPFTNRCAFPALLLPPVAAFDTPRRFDGPLVRGPARRRLLRL